MVTKKSEPMSYLSWVEGLQVGDKVKISSCQHSRCNCSTIVISGVTEMFGSKAFVVQDGCRTRYYSGVNGRELGSRKNTYKEGCLSIFTKKDAEAIEAAERKKLETERKRELSETLSKLLMNSNSTNLDYYLSNNLSTERMEELIAMFGKKRK